MQIEQIKAPTVPHSYLSQNAFNSKYTEYSSLP